MRNKKTFVCFWKRQCIFFLIQLANNLQCNNLSVERMRRSAGVCRLGVRAPSV